MPRGRLPARLCQLLLGASALLVAVPAGGQAPTGSVTVSRAADGLLHLRPTARASVAFRIEVRGATGAVVVHTEVPPGWRAIAPTDLELPRDSSALRVVSFFVPADAPAGRFTIRLGATSAAGHVSADSVLVQVPAHAAVEVALDESPRWVAPDDTFTVRFRVGNPGNVPLDVDLRLEASAGLVTRAQPAARRLAAGESFLLEAEATTLRGFAGRRHLLRLVATATNDSARAAVSAGIEVVGRGVPHGAPVRHALPGEVRFRMSDAGTGPSARLAAAGTLRPGGRTHFDVLMQGPHTQYSPFGDRDEYRIALVSPWLSLRLGDEFFRLSALTEAGRAGFGASGSVRGGGVEVGGYAQRDRRSHVGGAQQGVFVRVRERIVAFGVNWLRDDAAHAPTRELISTQGSIRAPGGWLTAEAEYGARFDAAADALSVNVRSARGPFALQLRHMRVDSAYGGTHAGTRRDAAQLSLRPWRRMIVEASVEDRASDRSFGGAVIAESVRTARVGVGYGTAMGEARLYTVERATAWEVTDRTVRSLAFRTRLPLAGVTVTSRLEGGQSHDRLAGATSAFWRAGANATLNRASGTYTAGLDYFSGGSIHSPTSAPGLTTFLSATYHPTGPMRLTLSASDARTFEQPHYGSRIVDARIERELPFGHSLGLRASVRESAGALRHRTSLVMIDYSIPLRIPLAGPASTGSVRGRVYDAASGEPMARVILEIGGRRAATDEHGRFEFQRLPEGMQRLRLDRTSAAASLVPAEPLPAEIEVRAGANAGLDIAMVPAASVEGTIAIVRPRPTAAASGGVPAAGGTVESAPEPLGGALVELSRGGERVRRAVDSRGRFSIADLRPGTWAITVVGAPLPPYYRFERDTVRITVAAGDVGVVSFLAAIVERRVELVHTAAISDAAVQPPSSARTVAPDAAARCDLGEATATAAAPLPTGWTLLAVPASVITLRGVARLMYGDALLWPKIWLANRAAMPDPDLLRPGSVLRIPARAPLTAAEEGARLARLQGR